MLDEFHRVEIDVDDGLGRALGGRQLVAVPILVQLQTVCVPEATRASMTVECFFQQDARW